ncbi:MAG: hypothetical protein EXR19_06425 [Chitinophagaceae bacterium]|nr:hypothetical protein [Chitinophagaceae bacterium]
MAISAALILKSRPFICTPAGERPFKYILPSWSINTPGTFSTVSKALVELAAKGSGSTTDLSSS